MHRAGTDEPHSAAAFPAVKDEDAAEAISREASDHGRDAARGRDVRLIAKPCRRRVVACPVPALRRRASDA
jgi:hypothetical protein